MIGVDKYAEHFVGFEGRYVLIGGAACELIFKRAGLEFRATRDLDLVLTVEAFDAEFVDKFHSFIADGGYKTKAKSDGKPQYYRFTDPAAKDYPQMLELFSYSDLGFERLGGEIIRLSADDEDASLSAILLDKDYYEMLRDGWEVIDGISVLKPEYIIPFKARAWLDLTEKESAGLSIKRRHINKHKDDIANLTMLFAQDSRVELPESARQDIKSLLERIDHSLLKPSFQQFSAVSPGVIVNTLLQVYGE